MPSDPIALDLNAPDDADLLQRLLKHALYSNKLALLFGSAISQFAPANIPMASDISVWLRDLVLNRFSPYAPSKDIQWGISEIPFEIFMSRLVDLAGTDVAEQFNFELTRIRQPNPVHLQIGALVDTCVAQGIDLSIVTTNYDLGIEYATKSKLTPIVEEKNVDKAQNKVCLFKPHGSRDVKGSPVFDSEGEFKLPPWKKNFLHKLLAGKTLVVLGYSGWDVDISLALNDCELETVVWCCYQMRNADIAQWSPGARQLINAKSRYRLVLNSVETETRHQNTLKVLESISPGFVDIELDHRAIKARFESALGDLPQDIQDAWLAWVITRAGYGHIGLAVKSLIDRTKISKARRLEYEATCYFYQGRHKTAALLERAAVSILRNDPHERAYHRTNEAAFWNRGHYSIMAIVSIARGLLELHFQGYKHDQFDSDVTSVRDQVMQIWPLQWLWGKPFGRKIAGAIVRYGAGLRTHEEQANLDRAAHIGTGNPNEELTKWRYRWLGQNARLINYQRLEARIALDRFRKYRQHPDFDHALQLVLDSALGAKHVGDSARLGKAHLLLAELLFEANRVGLPFQAGLAQRVGVHGSSWEGTARDSAKKGWQEIQASQTWFLSVWPAMWLCVLMKGLPDKVFGKKAKSILMSAASRWAGA